MIIHILTLFPDFFKGPFSTSIIKRAQNKELVEIKIHNIRDFSNDKHNTADDYPFGGGAGMVLTPGPLFKCIENITRDDLDARGNVSLLCPKGKVFNQKKAISLAKQKSIVLVCGHYEGIDERVNKYLINDEISIGDYVLSGGETAAVVIVDAVIRLLENSINQESVINDSFFTENMLDHPHFTRPRVFRGYKVPEVLLSGNHKNITEWRRFHSIMKTLNNRPDLLKISDLSKEDKKILDKFSKKDYYDSN